MVYSRLATPSATRAVLAAHGLSTKKRLGQHLLVDDNVIGRILSLAALDGAEIVLEVGPGIGTLTIALCACAASVVAVERDKDLVPVLEETTAAECPQFALVRGDALDVTTEAVSAPFGPPDALVANLPYSVAATVTLRMFEVLPSVEFAVVMVQAEVADRIAASPGTKDYGAYTVKLRLLAEPVSRFAVARGCFLPPPRVDSAVVRLERRPLADDPIELGLAAAAADAAFAQRRKTVRNSLKASLGVDPRALEIALEAASVDGGIRAETLPPDAFLRLGLSLNRHDLLPVRR